MESFNKTVNITEKDVEFNKGYQKGCKDTAEKIIKKIEQIQRCIKGIVLNDLIISLKKEYFEEGIMKNGMKPCPFCGNEDIRIHSIVFKEDILMDLFHYKADVICGNCRTVKMCVVSGESEEDCREKIKEEWNKRI